MASTVNKEAFFIMKKGNAKYLFKYIQGNEKQLFFALLEIGRSIDHEISLVEIFYVIKQMSKHIQSANFHLSDPNLYIDIDTIIKN